MAPREIAVLIFDSQEIRRFAPVTSHLPADEYEFVVASHLPDEAASIVERLRETGCAVRTLDDVSLHKVKYRISLSRWPSCSLGIAEKAYIPGHLSHYSVRLLDELGNDSLNLARWNELYDIILCPGPFHRGLLGFAKNTLKIEIGCPRLDNQFKNTLERHRLLMSKFGFDSRKQTVLCIPDRKPGVLMNMCSVLHGIAPDFNVLIASEPSAYEGIGPPLNESPACFVTEDSWAEALSVADIVLVNDIRDGFDAIYADKPVVIVMPDYAERVPDYGEHTSEALLWNNSRTVETLDTCEIRQALLESSKEDHTRREEMRKALFAPFRGNAGEFAASILLRMDRMYPSYRTNNLISERFNSRKASFARTEDTTYHDVTLEALQYFARQAKEKPTDSTGLFALGAMQRCSSEIAESLATFNRLDTTQPANSLVKLYLADFALQRGELDLAQDHLMAGLKLNDHNSDLWLVLAQVALEQGNLLMCTRTLQTSLAIKHSDVVVDSLTAVQILSMTTPQDEWKEAVVYGLGLSLTDEDWLVKLLGKLLQFVRSNAGDKIAVYGEDGIGEPIVDALRRIGLSSLVVGHFAPDHRQFDSFNKHPELLPAGVKLILVAMSREKSLRAIQFVATTLRQTPSFLCPFADTGTEPAPSILQSAPILVYCFPCAGTNRFWPPLHWIFERLGKRIKAIDGLIRNCRYNYFASLSDSGLPTQNDVDAYCREQIKYLDFDDVVCVHDPLSVAGLIDRPDLKIVILLRDPRDIIVSYYYRLFDGRYRQNEKRVEPKEDENSHRRAGLMRIMKGGVLQHSPNYFLIWPSVREMVSNFVDAIRFKQAFAVRFEDLHRDALETYRAVLNWLGIEPKSLFGLDLPDALLQKVVTLGSFEHQTAGQIRRGEDRSVVFMRNGVQTSCRKGIPGEWRTHFDPIVKEHFKSETGNGLVELGYEPDNNW